VLQNFKYDFKTTKITVDNYATNVIGIEFKLNCSKHTILPKYIIHIPVII